MSSNRLPVSVIGLLVTIFIVAVFGSRFFKAVKPGHVSVASLFGNVRDTPYPEGLHIPVNPFYK